MSDSYERIESIGELLVHASEIANESAERYGRLVAVVSRYDGGPGVGPLSCKPKQCLTA